MANFKKPSWFIDVFYQHVDGNFKKPSWFQDQKLQKFGGKGNVTEGYKAANIVKPTGKFNPGGYQDRNGLEGKKSDKGLMLAGRPDDTDPYGNYYFSLEISSGENQDGTAKNAVQVGHFQECSGLKNSTTPFEIEEGGMNSKAYKRPGQGKWENLVLKYATSASTFLIAWRDDWISGTDNWKNRTKYSGAVTLMNNKGDPIKRYEFKNAWPVSWEGPAFNGGDSSLAVETLEIAHDGLKIVDPPPPQ